MTRFEDLTIAAGMFVILLFIAAMGYAIGYQAHQQEIKDSYYDYGVYEGYREGIGQCAEMNYIVGDSNGTDWVKYNYHGTFDKPPIYKIVKEGEIP